MNINTFFLIVPVLQFAKWRSLKLKYAVYNINAQFIDFLGDIFGLLQLRFEVIYVLYKLYS